MEDDVKQLLKQLAKNDTVAIRALYKIISPIIQSAVKDFLLSREAVKDLVQDVLIIIWIRRIEIATMEYPVAFLKKCARNKASDYADHERKHRTFLICLKNGGFNESINLDLDSKVILSFIYQAVKVLPPQQKLVFKLCWEEHKTVKEVAAQLSLSIYTIKNTLYRSLNSIVTHLKSNSPYVLVVYSLDSVMML